MISLHSSEHDDRNAAYVIICISSDFFRIVSSSFARFYSVTAYCLFLIELWMNGWTSVNSIHYHVERAVDHSREISLSQRGLQYIVCR